MGRVAALCSLGDLISPSWFHSLLGLYHHSCHVIFLRSPVWNLALKGRLSCSSLLNLNLEHKGTACSLGPSILPQESSDWLNALFHREDGLAGPPSPTHAEKIWSKAMNPRVSVGEICQFWASLVAQMVKNLPVMQETWVSSLVQEDALEKGMATLSNILAWRISWTEEPGGL